MTQKLAVDVVLLPPKEIADQAIRISEHLKKKAGGPFALGEQDYFPHITLAMGVLDQKDLAETIKITERIARESKPLALTITKLEALESSVGGFVSYLQMEKTESLQALHKRMIEEVTPLFSFDSSPEIFVEPETIKEGTMRFIKSFPKKFDWEIYDPHITLGRGEAKEDFRPVSFTASTLAICKLGQFCTCRKLLFSTKLRDS